MREDNGYCGSDGVEGWWVTVEVIWRWWVGLEGSFSNQDSIGTEGGVLISEVS